MVPRQPVHELARQLARVAVAVLEPEAVGEAVEEAKAVAGLADDLAAPQVWRRRGRWARVGVHDFVIERGLSGAASARRGSGTSEV